MGAFASNLAEVSVFEAELTSILIAMEYAASHSWYSFWIECDSTSTVQALKNADIIPFRLRNRWHNCFQRDIRTLCSHVYREGNCRADKLVDFGHSIMGTVWLDSLPQSMSADFFTDRMGLPNYRFP
jgi:ribonuclease HI